jgi:hypothetical protein
VLGEYWDITGCWGNIEVSMEEETRSSSKLCNEERHGWYCLPNVIRLMKSNWACGTCGGEKCILGFGEET